MAVSADGERWLLVNASPDLRQQIAAAPELHPRGRRHSPVAAVLLTNGDVDHVAGLLSLRERQAFALHATHQTLRALGDNRIFDVADPELVKREPVELGRGFEPLAGLRVELFAVPGKVPLWLEDEELAIGEETESTVGAVIAGGGRRIVYIPGCASVTEGIRERIRGADLLLFDGTLWRDDEMTAAGLGSKSGRRMGHMPISGPDGSMAALADVDVGRRVFVHLNNTNLGLVEDSSERASAERSGWEIGFDGMRFLW